MNDIEKYLNSIVDYMVRHSKDNQLPFDNSKISFNDYCRNEFGLTLYESDYVWYRYKTLMGWDPQDHSPEYLNYVLNKWLMDNG